MSKPYIHAQSSAKRFGGSPWDYMNIHEFMDSSKSAMADNRHRALTHNAWFISTVIPAVFGETFYRESDGAVVSARDIAEQHCMEDFGGWVPTAQDYIGHIPLDGWVNGKGTPPSLAKAKGEPVKFVIRD